MLRVTEEKERNFEKRGYMGKKVLGVLTILLILTGCQNMGNESENLQQVKKSDSSVPMDGETASGCATG